MPDLNSVLAGLVSQVQERIAESRAASKAPCIGIAACLAEGIRGLGPLPKELCEPSPDGYRRVLLHEAEDGSFSIGLFVWGVGQATRIHDHRSWGVIGVVKGPLRSERFDVGPSDEVVKRQTDVLTTGQTAWVDPAFGDIHRIGSLGDHVGLSIHVYGCRFDVVCKTYYAESN